MACENSVQIYETDASCGDSFRLYDLLPTIIRLKDYEASGQNGETPILDAVTCVTVQREAEDQIELIAGMRLLLDALRSPEPFRSLLYNLLGQQRAEGWTESLETFFLREAVPWHKISGTVAGWKKALEYRTSGAYRFNELFKTEANEVGDYSPRKNDTYPLRAARVSISPEGLFPYDWSADTITIVPPYIPAPAGSDTEEPTPTTEAIDYDLYGSAYSEASGVYDLLKIDAGSRRREQGQYGFAVAIEGDWAFVGTGGDNVVDVYRRNDGGNSTPIRNEIQRLSLVFGAGTFHATVPGYGTTAGLTESSTESQIQSALEEVVGAGNVEANGGPLNVEPVSLQFVGELEGLNIGSLTTDANPVDFEDGSTLEPYLVQDGDSDAAAQVLEFRLAAMDDGILAGDIAANPANYRIRFEIGEAADAVGTIDTSARVLRSSTETPEASASTLIEMLLGEWQYLNSSDNQDFGAPAYLFTESDFSLSGTLLTGISLRFSDEGSYRGINLKNPIRLSVLNATSTDRVVSLLEVTQRGSIRHGENLSDKKTVQRLKILTGVFPTSGAVRLKVGNKVTDPITFEASPYAGFSDGDWFGWKAEEALCEALQKSVPSLPATVSVRTLDVDGDLISSGSVAFPFTASALQAFLGSSTIDPSIYDVEVSWVSPPADNFEHSYSFRAQGSTTEAGLPLAPEVWEDAADPLGAINTLFADLTALANHLNSISERVQIRGCGSQDLNPYGAVKVEYAADGDAGVFGTFSGAHLFVVFQGNGYLASQVPLIEVLDGNSTLGVQVDIVQNGYSHPNVNRGDQWVKVQTLSPSKNEIQRVEVVEPSGSGNNSFTLTVPRYGESSAIPETANRNQLRTALELAVGVGNVLTTGGPLPEAPIDVEFTGDLSGVNVDLMQSSAAPEPYENAPFTPVDVQDAKTDYTNLMVSYDLDDSGLLPSQNADIVANPGAYFMRFEADSDSETILVSQSLDTDANVDDIREALTAEFSWKSGTEYATNGFADVQILTDSMIEVTGSLASSIRVRFVSPIFAARGFSGSTPGLLLSIYNSSGTLLVRLGKVVETPTGVEQNFPPESVPWMTIKKLVFTGSRPTTGGMRLRLGDKVTETISFEIADPSTPPLYLTTDQLKSRILGNRIQTALNRSLYPEGVAPSFPATIHFIFQQTTSAGGGFDRVNIPHPFTVAGVSSVISLSDLANWKDATVSFVSPLIAFFPANTGQPNLQDRVVGSQAVFSNGIVERTYLERGGNVVDAPLSAITPDMETFVEDLNEIAEFFKHFIGSNVANGHYETGYPVPPGADTVRQFRLFFQNGLFGQQFPELEILQASSGQLTVNTSEVQDGEPASNSQFGRALSVWLESSVPYATGYLAIGAPNDRNGTPAIDAAGAVFIYRLTDTGRWVYHRKLTDPLLATASKGFQFGQFLDLEGTTLVVGSLRETDRGPNTGAAYVFQDWGFWQQLLPDVLTSGSLFGGGVSLQGSQIAVSARRFGESQGAVFLFEETGGVWAQTARLQATDALRGAQFGRAVAIRGSHLFVSAKLSPGNGDRGVVYVYDRTSLSILKSFLPEHRQSQGQFGRFLSVDRTGTRLLVAEPGLQVSGRDSAGTAHLYAYDREVNPELGARWRYVEQIRPFGPQSLNARDYFSEAVAVSEEHALIGSPRHRFDVNGQNPIQGAGAGWFYQVLGTPPANPDLLAAVVCDGFAILPVGLLDPTYQANDDTSIVIPAGTDYAPQIVVPPPPSFTPTYDRIILRVRASAVNGTLHASTTILPGDVRVKFIDNVTGVREFEFVWYGRFNIDFSDTIYVNLHAAPGINADVSVTAAELVIRQEGAPEDSCLEACECLCQSAAETGTCRTTCEANCQTGCENSAQGYTDPSLQYELAGRIEVNKCLGNSLHYLDAMQVLETHLQDQRPIHVLPVYCVTTIDSPEVLGEIGDRTSANVIGKFFDSVSRPSDSLVIRPDCTQGCQVNCETFCEVGCEDNCQGIGPCENSCQLRCEAVCQTDCELVCQAGCVVSCQGDACQTLCQSACEAVCQIACENFCQGVCEIAGCQLSCTSGCEDNCEFACQQRCEFDCQSPAERGCATSCQDYCQVCCEEDCEAGSCQTDCQAAGCQTACQIVCQQSCTFTCETTCQAECQSSCEVLCQQACEGSCQSACENNCQQACEGGGCEVACEGGCQSGCQSSCEVTCEGASCQATCEESGCQSCCECQCQSDSCEQECTTGCTTGCQTACESACQAAGGCETGCEAACENSTESCEDCCEICCEEYTEYGCETSQEACQAACQVNEQGPCTTVCEAQACETICQTPCESVCQIGGIEGCSAIESVA